MKITQPSGRNPAPYTRHRAGAWRAALMAVACLLTGAVVQAAPRLLVTIDVESVYGSTLPSQIDANCRDYAPCGLMEIARLLETHALRGTFFLNVYESKQWGEPAMRELTERLMQRGHDVALHTHPHWSYDPKRPYMHEYGLEEQIRIVREGAQLLHNWSGLPVVAHRAGAYSANPHTLEALRANGIALDSSWFRDYPHSQLASLGLSDNVPAMALGITEIPVTIYERVETPYGLGFLPGVVSTRKLDVNWFRDAGEAAAAVDALIATDPPFVVYFLHSFSLLIPDGSTSPAADMHALTNFRVMLERASAHRLAGETFRGLHDAGRPLITEARGVVPRVPVAAPLPNYLAHLATTRPWLFAMLTLTSALLAWLPWFAWRAWRRPRPARLPAH